MYFLALNYRSEGWQMNPYETLDEIKKEIILGQTFGNEFKVLKEIEISITDENGNP